MTEKKPITEADVELVRTILDHQEALRLAHSRLRRRFITAEVSCLSKLASVESELDKLVGMVGEKAGLDDISGWRLDFEESAFLREVEDEEPELELEPEPEPESEPEEADPIAALRAKYGK